MALADFFKRKRKSLDGDAARADGDDVSPVAGDLGTNDAVQKRQRMILTLIAGVFLVGALFWIFGGSGGKDAESAEGKNGEKIEVSTKDIMNRNLSEQEWMALSEERFTSAEHQLKTVDGQQRRLAEMEAEIGQLRGQNSSMQADGQRVVSAYQEENEQLRRQLAERRTAPPAPVAGPAAMYGQNGPQAYERPGAAGKGAPPPVTPGGEVKTIAFQTTNGGTAKPVEKGSTVYTDSVNYLPPNSFASAKVVVGVDASAGVGSQTDPLPVVLRITGPARSVFQNGKLLTTKIEGCLVNGAARGELSSEKVYVKLQKMTCPQPGGRYAVSEVKGFLAFGGKTGVRGRVVSREGGLVTQAFIAGLVGGFGRGFSANANSVFQGGTTINTDGKRDQLSTSEILEGGFGEGVAQTGDMVSKYLIERAEQYQPVIEMPTGIDVEVVFLEGVYVRN